MAATTVIDRRLALSAIASAWIASTATRAETKDSPTLRRIRETGRLRIGVASGEPWFFRNSASEWSGIGVAAGKQLAVDIGATTEPVETTWSDAVLALQAGRIDVMFALDPTSERRTAVDFPGVDLFQYATSVVTRPPLAAEAWSDLDQPQTRLGVTLGTSVDKQLSGILKAASIRRFSSNDEAVTAFLSRRIEAVAQATPAMVAQAGKIGMGRLFTPVPTLRGSSSAGIQLGDLAFRAALDTRFLLYREKGLPMFWLREYLRNKYLEDLLKYKQIFD